MTNPTQKFTSYGTGPDNQKPVAVLAHPRIDTLLGSIIQLDGRESFDPEGQALTWRWRFVQAPIGSTVEATGFRDIRPQSRAVSFIPDKTGVYVVELVVNDGELDSDPVTSVVNIQLSRVPVGENILPDARFLWNFISNFWNLVTDKEKITSIWSAAIQLLGAELIKLWSYDYNKSLNTIQSTFQRRWQRFPTYTDLYAQHDQRVIVGKTDSGINGSSGGIGEAVGVGYTSIFKLPLGNVGDGDATDFTNLQGNYGAKGRILVAAEDTYTISRVDNSGETIDSAADGETTVGTNQFDSASVSFGDAQVGDQLIIKNGSDAGTYKIKVISPGQVEVSWPADPPEGPLPSFSGQTGLSFEVQRPYTLAIVDEAAIPQGLSGVQWRIPHLLHTPGTNLEEDGVRAGDVVVFTVTRNDIGLSTEVQAQVVGVDRERLGFEFSMKDLDASVNYGNGASIVESGGVTTISGLTGMRPASVGSSLEILNGDNPGVYRILSFIDETSVTVSHALAAGADSGNPNIQWVERGRRATNLDRELFRQIVQDLRIVPSQATSEDIVKSAEALISFIPIGINLSTRYFSPYKLSFRAKRVIHNSLFKVPTITVSIPALQETVANPPVVLKENLDYIVESGFVSFLSGTFSLDSPPPEEFWAEMVIYDNREVIESNFGRLVNASYEDISGQTQASYLSAVKGLFFAFTNGPAVDNIRLGLQILLGLPFTESRVRVLERDDSFSTEIDGSSTGRLLVEDVDERGNPKGYRRVYFYPTIVGLEVNPVTGELYQVGDIIEQFKPISKGVTVEDYVNTPRWWIRAFYGMEVLKFFTFKVAVESSVFDNEDIAFAFDFISAIKPAYTQVMLNVLLSLEDEIELTDYLGGLAVAKFYDNIWGLEATNKATDDNQQGVTLWNLSSRPFRTRTIFTVRDAKTEKDGTQVKVSSVSGWDASLLRGRQQTSQMTKEGDLVYIHAGQPGAGSVNPGLYEIDTVTDDNALHLRNAAPFTDPDTLDVTALDADLFEYGDGLVLSIIRRDSNPVTFGDDLQTDSSTGLVSSASAKFLTNHITPGDHLVIGGGEPDEGEWIIDAIPHEGSAASIVESGGIVSVTGLTGMTTGHVGRFLEVFNGDNPGLFRILVYVSATEVQIYSPSASGADSGNPSIQWRVLPEPPYLTETQVYLRNEDGSPAALSGSDDQLFFVVRPLMQPGVIYNCKTIWTGSKVQLQAPEIYPGWPHLVFTPGMVGTWVSVSDSQNPANDGVFLITEFFTYGLVGLDSPSTSSDTVAQSTVKMVAQV